jgi:HAD superfamily hydrolase (TIGR01509 family)
MNDKTPIAFLFDLDGVIIDSETRYTEIWEKIEKVYPTGINNFAIKIKGTTLTNILDTYFPNPKIQPEVKKMLHELESKMIYDYCPGAEQLLHKLNELNVPIALVTSSDNVKMAHLYEQHPELQTMFNSIIDANKVTHSKPHPEGYLKGAAETGAKPRNCVVVEDSLQGLKAGHAAGSFTIGVCSTLGREIIASHADITINSVQEIDVEKICTLLAER